MNTDREGLTQSEFNAKYAPWRDQSVHPHEEITPNIKIAPWREIARLTDQQVVDMPEQQADGLIDRISIELTGLVRSHIKELRNKA